MLVIAGRIRIDPLHREPAIAAATVMMRETRQEKGCISYTISADVEDPGLFHIFEEWESQENLSAHFQSPHMAQFSQQIAGFSVKERHLQRYQIAAVSPLG